MKNYFRYRLISFMCAIAVFYVGTAVSQTTSEEDIIRILALLFSEEPLSLVNAGEDTHAVTSSTFELAGIVYGGAATYEWEQLSGPAITLQTASNPWTLRFSAPDVSGITQLSFRFTVSDGNNTTLTDDVSINIHPNEAPELIVDFPCDNCRSYGSAISIRGRANNDADDVFVQTQDEITVSVQIADQVRETSVAENGEWFLEDMPVPSGVNDYTMVIIATDKFGKSDEKNLELEHLPTLIEPVVAADPVKAGVYYLFETGWIDRLTAYDNETLSTIYESNNTDGILDISGGFVDPDGSHFIYAELFTGIIAAIDLDSGTLSTISGAGFGTGPSITRARSIALDEDDRRLAVFDDEEHALYLVDLDTGNRSIVVDHDDGDALDGGDAEGKLAVDSVNDVAYLNLNDFIYEIDLETGGVEQFDDPVSLVIVSSIAFNPDESELAIVRPGLDRIVVIDVDSQNESVLSPDGTSGIELGASRQIITDPHENRFLVNGIPASSSSESSDSFVAVDTVTGDRETVFHDGLGNGPTVKSSPDIKLSGDGNSVYILSRADANLIEVSLLTHDRNKIADGTSGPCTQLQSPQGLILFGENHAFVADAGQDAILKVDLTNGTCTVVSDSVTGTGADFSGPVSLTIDSSGETLYVIDHELLAVIRVDIATGNRNIISDNSNTGHQLIEPTAIAFDQHHNRLLVADNGTGTTESIKLMGVDLVTGDRSAIVSSSEAGAGTSFDDITDIYVMGSGNTAIISSTDSFYNVDLNTGDRNLIATSYADNGEILKNTHHLVLDEEKGLIYSWVLDLRALVVIDTVSGDRVVLSK